MTPKTSTVWTTMPETTKNQRLPGTGKPHQLMPYTWWIHQMEAIMRKNGTWRRTTPPTNNQSGDATGIDKNGTHTDSAPEQGEAVDDSHVNKQPARHELDKQ